MSIKEVLDYQAQMRASKNYPSDAVGKYQIISGTLKDGVKKLKIPLTAKFDKTIQDRLYREYLTGSKRKDLQSYLSGSVQDTPENLMAAEMDMAREFASFGVPRPVKAHEFGTWPKNDLKTGDSYYSGAGGNKASVSAEQSAKSIREERMLRLNSIENQDAKKQSGTTVIVDGSTNTTVIGSTNKTSQILSIPSKPDLPYFKKQGK